MFKTPHNLPAEKLVTLPILNRPWSHLEVDFMTDLAASEGNACIFFFKLQIDFPSFATSG